MNKLSTVFAAMALVGISAGVVTPAFAKGKKICDESGKVCKAGTKDCNAKNCAKKP